MVLNRKRPNHLLLRRKNCCGKRVCWAQIIHKLALVDSTFVLNGLYFALRTGSEHRHLQSHHCQIQLTEKPGQCPLKTSPQNRQGGLKGRKVKPKVVPHHDNPSNPDRCFVRLFKLYQSQLPQNRPSNSFFPYFERS